MTGSGWHGIQIYYYDDAKDDLLLDAVRPVLADAVAAGADRAFVTRHWLRGPHLRLAFRVPATAFDGVIRAPATRRIGAHLRDRPSRSALTEQRLAPVHRELAARERESGPVTPWYPDNSIRFDRPDRRLDVLGSAEAAEMLEEFHHRSGDQLFAALEAVRAGTSRLGVALDLMLATAHALWPDIRRGFVSFRSHAEGFIVQADDPAARRRFCEERYRAHRDEMRRRLHHVLGTVDGDGDGGDGGDRAVPFVREWVALLRTFADRARPLIADGRIRLDAAPADDPERARSWSASELAASPFHARLQGSGTMAALQADTGFLRFRLALNYLYLYLNRLGVRPFERFLLCHLAARAVEERFGVSADDLVGGWAS